MNNAFGAHARSIVSRIRSFFALRKLDDDFAQELESHLDLLTNENIRRGMSPDEAKRAARLKLGSEPALRETHHDQRTVRWLESLAQDIRSLLRGFRRRPAFALIVVLTAAIGIGSSTAVFSVVDRILFRPLPYAHSEQLVSVGMMTPLDTNEFMFASPYFELRRSSGPFESVTSFQAGTIACDLTDVNPVRLACLNVEANFLQTLGISPLVGRMFSRAEDMPNGPPVAVISYGLWKSRFGSDLQVIGRTIPIDGTPTEIVGVLPGDFEVPTLAKADVLLPERLNDATERDGRALRVFARLKTGVSIRQARAQLDPYFELALQTVPAPFRKEVALRVRSIRDRQVDDVRTASLMLFGAVLAVLLIACANVANLLLARATKRRQEFAMRAALGATPSRLARYALTESMLFALLAGTVGCALAYALLRMFIAIAPAGLPRLQSATIDFRVLLFTLVLSLGSGLVFGIAPALRVPSSDSLSGWRERSHVKGGLSSVLVTIQVAFSIILLGGASLLLRSLWNLESVPLGMEAQHVIAAQFELSRDRYGQTNQQVAFFTELERRVAALPGIDSFAISNSGPISGGLGRPLAAIAVQGRPSRPEGTGGMVSYRYVTPGYFDTFGIPILNGRAFTEQDRAADIHSVVLSKKLAQLLFPGRSPIGQEILRDPPGPWFTVVGVAGDVRNLGPASQIEPAYYIVRKGPQSVSLDGEEARSATLSVRTVLAPELIAPTLRTTIAAIDSTLPVNLQTMSQRVDELTQRPRFDALLLTVFGGVGTLLAATGLFALMSFIVAQRIPEIGVRMALGATPSAITRWMLSRALRWFIPGIVFGFAGSYAAARLLRSLLFDVSPYDPVSLVGALVLLSFVAAIAVMLPARRAMRVDPMEALRHE